MEECKLKEDRKIPEWMSNTEEYVPEYDRETFLNRTAVRIMGVLSMLKVEDTRKSKTKVSYELKIFMVLICIILTSSAKNISFVIIILSCFIVRLSFLEGRDIKSILKTAFTGAVITALIMIPAVLMGNAKSMVSMSIKVFTSVLIVAIMNHTLKWNRFTFSLHSFHIPDLIIFSFDMTVKYLVILGELSSRLIESLKVRSIGRNKKKDRALSGILGITYIKSRIMSEETYQAMECRGFDGTYKGMGKTRLGVIDFVYILMMIMVILSYTYLEVIIK